MTTSRKCLFILVSCFITLATCTNTIDPLNQLFHALVSAPTELSSETVVQRSEWGARPPSEPLTDLKSPASRVIIAHTATPVCNSRTDCSTQVRNIQNYHMTTKEWFDIAYNFLIGGDGAVYVGRGWDKMGAHSKGFNSNSICIAFIGTFQTTTPNYYQVLAANQLIDEGVQLQKLTQDYHLYGHRQVIPTQSPGDALFNIIKKWPHFSENV